MTIDIDGLAEQTYASRDPQFMSDDYTEEEINQLRKELDNIWNDLDDITLPDIDGYTSEISKIYQYITKAMDLIENLEDNL